MGATTDARSPTGSTIDAAELDAALAARVPTALPVTVAQGGTGSASAGAALTALGAASAASVTALPSVVWTLSLPQDPGNAVYEEMRAPSAGSILSVAVLAPVLGASAAGTYLLDVTADGVSVLTGTINLEALVAGTWSTGTIKTDGTEDFVSGEKIRVTATSNNADLAGYTDGIMVTVAFAASGA